MLIFNDPYSVLNSFKKSIGIASASTKAVNMTGLQSFKNFFIIFRMNPSKNDETCLHRIAPISRLI